MKSKRPEIKTIMDKVEGLEVGDSYCGHLLIDTKGICNAVYYYARVTGKKFKVRYNTEKKEVTIKRLVNRHSSLTVGDLRHFLSTFKSHDTVIFYEGECLVRSERFNKTTYTALMDNEDHSQDIK